MSELVERTGVAAATVRYYLASGLLPPPRRAKTNRFLYDERHVEVIRLIRLLQDRRHLSLETIGKMLPELLPDLTGGDEGSVFRPEMWGQLLAAHFPTTSSPSPADRLRDAGVVAFARHGYADVSVDDICQATGIAKGSFYRHFSSKEELFFAVVARVGEIMNESHLDQSSPDGQDAQTSLIDALRPFLAVVLDLTSMASQRRPGYARALGGLISSLSQAAGGSAVSSEVTSGSGRAIVAAAIGEAVASLAAEGGTARAGEALAYGFPVE